MAGEDRPATWTLEAVKAHLLAVIEGNDRLYRERFEGQAQEFREFRSTTEARFAGVNEFRGALADAQRALMPRAEAEARFTAIQTDLALLKEAQNARSSEGTGLKSGWGWAVAVVMLALAVYLGLKP